MPPFCCNCRSSLLPEVSAIPGLRCQLAASRVYFLHKTIIVYTTIDQATRRCLFGINKLASEQHFSRVLWRQINSE